MAAVVTVVAQSRGVTAALATVMAVANTKKNCRYVLQPPVATENIFCLLQRPISQPSDGLLGYSIK